MPRVLVINECVEHAGRLQQALLENGHEVLATRLLSEQWIGQIEALQPDLVVMDIALPDSRLLDQIRTISSRWPRPVVIFADQDDSEIMAAAVDAGVHAYVVDGFDGRRLGSILDVAVARFRVYQTLRDELDRTRSSLRERKLVDRAKGILMNKRHWSEEQAYRALQKMAMDQNRRLADVAERLIEMSELFE
ncbi:ANTAR domain-containing response regulator [Sedimenticola hydrogenitrophicus]|uniref:ANTAR domain-containing response regulator n=1 Tax=Sedimenticola hydrogenitrophicus TaxID=2967975 RepID=UPI0021A72E26|nr:ANTAR domain-containing protein [Sedimenticola hydrogenitrophicus]